MNFIAATLGRAFPKYRTLGQWAEIYHQIVATREISAKTKANRRSMLIRIVERLGDRLISTIRPHEISAMMQGIAQGRAQLAKRILFETRDMFNEAVNYGWIDRNPAATVKTPQARVQRKRLAFDDWCKIAAWSEAHQPPWVQRMLMLALVTGQRRSDLAKMRFDDVLDGRLHVEQQKTGERIAIPITLRLEALGLSIADVIEDCRVYATAGEFMLRKHNGQQLVLASLSARFEEAREHALAPVTSGLPPSLHECRSLSERLYRAQGVNTMILLGHKHQSMTDIYNDDRGLTKGVWRELELVAA